MSFSLSPEGRRRVDEILRRYPEREAALLPVLHVIQREYGSVSAEAEDWAAGLLGVPALRVQEVMSFYSLLRRRPAGTYRIQVCRNLSCFLGGADGLIRHLEAALGIRAGETTPDGRFTLETVECLGHCDHAPCLMVNDDDYGPVTPAAADDILMRLKDDAR
jgi:NADH-quinone oxidoreductase subunit E